MEKTKLLKGSVLILVILNLLSLAMLFCLERIHPPKWEGPKAIIVEKLQFNEEQVEDYELLIKAHQQEVIQANERITNLKASLYQNLKQEDIHSSDSIISLIGKEQMKLEDIHFQHFIALKGLCNDEQIQSFNALCDELALLFKQKGNKAP